MLPRWNWRRPPLQKETFRRSLLPFAYLELKNQTSMTFRDACLIARGSVRFGIVIVRGETQRKERRVRPITGLPFGNTACNIPHDY